MYLLVHFCMKDGGNHCKSQHLRDPLSVGRCRASSEAPVPRLSAVSLENMENEALSVPFLPLPCSEISVVLLCLDPPPRPMDPGSFFMKTPHRGRR